MTRQVNMKLHIVKWAVGLMAVTATVTACTSGQEDAADSGVIRVAVLMPESGPTASIGKAYVATLEHLVAQVADEGGLEVSGQKYEVELEVFDDGGTAELAQRAAREVVDAGFDFMIGPFGSAATSGIVPVMAQADLVWMVNSNVAGPTKNPRAFRSTMLQSAIDGQFVEWVRAHPEVDRVAITTDQLFTGAAERTEDFIEEVEDAGAEVVASEAHQLGDTDLRPIITKMKADAPDVYLIRGYPTETPVFVSQVRELAGPEPLIAFQPPLTTEETAKAFPDPALLEGVLTVGGITGFDPLVAEGDERATALDQVLGDGSGAFSVWAHDAFQVFLEALRRADEPTSDAVAASLEDLTVADIAEVTFNEYRPRDGELLFGADREVDLVGATLTWTPGGWIRQRD